MIGWIKYERCPLCKSREKHLYSSIYYSPEEAKSIADQLELDEGGGLSLYYSMCECTFVYVDRYMDDMKTYYSTLYTRIHEERVGREALTENEANRAKRLAERFPDAENSETVLDIGCASGKLMELLDGKGYLPYGVDMRPAHCEFGTAWPSLDHAAPMEYDIITMIHMVEHLEDPISYMEGLRKFMGEKSQIFIEVPSLAPSAGTLSLNHPVGYTTHAMRDMLQKSGYKVRACGVVPIADERGWRTVIQAVCVL
ncbi:MAG: class I SAM-dependent methyltransferase [Candidatus Thorarchaeota archaeon]